MSVVSVKEGYSSVRYSGSGSSEKTLTRVFSAVVDDATDTPLTLAADSNIPQAGDTYPSDASFRAGVPDISKISPYFYNVTVTYGTSEIDFPTGGDNPLSEPASIDWDDAESVEPVDKDADGEALVNAVDEPFDPAPTHPFNDAVLIIQRNQAAFYAGDKYIFGGSVCSHTFWGAPAGTALMKSIRAHYERGSINYWKVTYRIQFRLDRPAGVNPSQTWYHRLLNQGYRYYDDDGQLLIAKDDAGDPVSQPILLDADGKKLAAGATPVWLLRPKYRVAAWWPLGIDSGDLS